MKKAAILVDGEWFRRSLEIALKGSLPNGVTAEVMYKNALLALAKDEELFRLFYYDCPPYHGKETNPIDKSTVDFKSPFADAASDTQKIGLMMKNEENRDSGMQVQVRLPADIAGGGPSASAAR